MCLNPIKKKQSVLPTFHLLLSLTSAWLPADKVLLHLSQRRQGRCQSLPSDVTFSAIVTQTHKHTCQTPWQPLHDSHPLLLRELLTKIHLLVAAGTQIGLSRKSGDAASCQNITHTSQWWQRWRQQKGGKWFHK